MFKTIVIVYHEDDFSENNLSILKNLFVDPYKEKDLSVITVNTAKHIGSMQKFLNGERCAFYFIVVLGPSLTLQYKTREDIVGTTTQNCWLVPVFWLPYDNDQTNFHDVHGLGSYRHTLSGLSKNEIYKEYVKLTQSIRRFIKEYTSQTISE